MAYWVLAETVLLEQCEHLYLKNCLLCQGIPRMQIGCTGGIGDLQDSSRSDQESSQAKSQYAFSCAFVLFLKSKYDTDTELVQVGYGAGLTASRLRVNGALLGVVVGVSWKFGLGYG